MYDLNFLQTTVEKKKKSPLTGILIALSVLLLIGIALFYVYMSMDMKETEKELSELQEYIVSEDVKNQYEELGILRSELDVYEKHITELNKLNKYLAAIDYAKGSVIDGIFMAAPDSVAFESVNLRDRYIDIQAVADNEAESALWLHKLKQVEIVESADISSISIDEVSGKVSVSLSCILQEVITK